MVARRHTQVSPGRLPLVGPAVSQQASKQRVKHHNSESSRNPCENTSDCVVTHICQPLPLHLWNTILQMTH
ncbi:hypothetical protein PAMP_005830 [Pampus punctatissimus]